MKLEKDRLIAKVDNLQLSMNQLSEENIENSLEKGALSKNETSAAFNAGHSSTKQTAQQAQGSTAAVTFANKTN